MSKPPRPFTSPARIAAAASTGGRLPAELAAEIATTHDGRDITRPYTHELEEFRDQRLQGALDWGVYDRILLDDQVTACLQQRRSAVTSREWSVIPGDDKDPRAKAAAEALDANLRRLSWTRKTGLMLRAPFYGIAVAELCWEVRDGLFQWSAIKVRHARRFRYDKERRLRLITTKDQRGEILPERKFWVVTAGADDDDQPYGRGLAEWLYWPTLFKRNGIRFWNIFLDRFSVPPAKGSYPRGTSQAEITKLLESMMALANDSGIAVPEGVAIEFMQVATNGIDFEKMPTFMDEAIAKIILSQTMTTSVQAAGLGSGQANVHAGVKQEVVLEDADMLSDSFTEGPARWFTNLNFGTEVAAPILTYLVEEEEDLKATAETDAELERAGWVRTEESFRDVYGDGFERKPAAATPLPGRKGAQPRTNPANDVEDGDRRTAAASFAEPRTLYVHRRLKNAKDLIAWAKQQGFKSAVPAGEMHVTVAYSRRPVDWFEMGQAWSAPDGSLTIPAGGPRQVERLGDKGSIVLMFASSELDWRHREMREKGAGWDFADYRPHVTITYDGGAIDLAAIEPYQGKLVFGPEIFEPVDDDWTDGIAEVSFAEHPEADIVDQAVQQVMADEGWRAIAADLGIDPLVEQLTKASSADEVDAILRREAELGDAGKLGERLARAGFAVRMTAAVGED